MKTTFAKKPGWLTPLLFLTLLMVAAPPLAAQPGTLIQNVNLPVPGSGVSVAADCEGNVYYTLFGDTNLYVMDAAGMLLNTVPIVDAVTGQALDIDEMAWDESRKILWGQLHGSNPVQVYQINAGSGAANFGFTSQTISVGSFRDGLAYDGTDDTLWISGDVSTTIEHYQSDGTFINAITPTNAGGGTLGQISGVTVGVGDLLYLGRNGAVEIVQVRKSDGGFLASFASPGGARDEGLECDPINFPVLALWSREFNPPGFVSAIELEPGTCECGGGGVLTCTQGFWKNHPEEWENLDPAGVPAWGGGFTFLQILRLPPQRGDASIILAHAFIAATLNSGAPAADLAAAEALLIAHPVGSGDLVGKSKDPDRPLAIALADSLQAFNESAECPLPRQEQ